MRFALLRTKYHKDKRINNIIYIPIYSNDLIKLEAYYNYYINQNQILNIPIFNEVAIFDYEKCVYVKNNFKDREFYVNNIRR